MISGPMLASAVTGGLLLAFVAAIFLVQYSRRHRRSLKRHKAMVWTLAIAGLLHGAWGVVAIFVLKS